MHTIPFTLEIHGMKDGGDAYKIHRMLLKEVYMAEFKVELARKTITMHIRDEDREQVIDLIEGLGFSPKIVQRFTTGIEGIF